jgi:hypothetical protein
MPLPVKARHLPPRVAAGAFILNSGIGKLSADEATAAQLHEFATGAYPFLGKLKPKDFLRLLAVTEITLGSLLLMPLFPAGVAGAGLAPARLASCFLSPFRGQHQFDPLVVVEVLQVPQVRHRGGHVRVQVRRAVPRDLQVVSCGERGAAEELGDPAAPGHVELQASSPAATRTACPAVYPPLASTYSSACGPITSRASRTRARSRRSPPPHDSPILIFTRGICCLSAHPLSWSRVRSSE